MLISGRIMENYPAFRCHENNYDVTWEEYFQAEIAY
jgi:hypothetical protein